MNTLLVVDASVVVKWYFDEPGSEQARSLLAHTEGLCAPDLLFAETTQVIWKRVRRGDISAANGQKLVAEVAAADVRPTPCRALAEDACALASRLGHSVYDCMYLALALRLDAPVVTADKRLLAVAMAAAELRGLVRPLSAD